MWLRCDHLGGRGGGGGKKGAEKITSTIKKVPYCSYSILYPNTPRPILIIKAPMLVDSGTRCWAQGFRVQGADSDVLSRCLWPTTAFFIFVFQDLRLGFRFFGVRNVGVTKIP